MRTLGIIAIVSFLGMAGCGYHRRLHEHRLHERSDFRRAQEDFRRAGWEAREEFQRARRDFQRDLREARDDFHREMRQAHRDFRDEFGRW